MSEVLSKFCPFFVQVDRRGRIVTLGPSMAKVLGGAADPNITDCDFLDIFEITRPANFTSISSMAQDDGAKLSLCLRAHPDIRMKAALSLDMQSDTFFLSPSFGIGIQAAIGRFGLTMTDFATTDMVPELLYLIEANQAAMQASKRLTIRLQGAKAAAEEQAHSDTLTGLRNRRALDVALDHLIAHRQKFSIIQMDLDRFKAVNDTYGHAAGDAVLTHIAKVMRRETRQCDILVRLGGDEFLIILPDLTDVNRLTQLGQAIISGIEAPVMFDGHMCHVSASLGVVTCSNRMVSDANADDLLVQVDQAVYAAKNAGRGCVRFVSDLLTDVASDTFAPI